MAEADEISGCFVGIIIVDEYSWVVPKFLVVLAEWNGNPPQHKFPGGMHKTTDRDFEATARRELQDETGFRIRQGVVLTVFDNYKIEDQRKYFFLVKKSKCRGKLRSTPVPDGDSVILEFKWLTYEELERDLLWKHQPPLTKLKEQIKGLK